MKRETKERDGKREREHASEFTGRGSAVCVRNLQDCTLGVYPRAFEEVIERFERSTKEIDEGARSLVCQQ